MHISRRQLWVACLAAGIVVPVAVVTGANAATTDSAPTLTTTVQVDSAAGAPTVRFTARNTSSATVNVLSQDLPQARQTRTVLTVTRDGTPVPYRGQLVKHTTATAANYTRIASGGSYTVTVNLADDYDLSQPGTYAVTLASTQVRVRNRAGSSTQGTARVKASQGVIRTTTGVQGSAKTSVPTSATTTTETVTTDATTAATGVTIAYRGCSSSQQTQLRQAVSDAAQYTAKARTWLAAHPSGGGLYKTWFGAYSSTRFTRASSAFTSIATELTSRTVTLDCTSTEPYMAYVYANDAYTIYVCSGYWPASATGYDSKAGTLIHESSHFTVNGGAEDYIYGLAEGKQLASSSPDKAVANADNIEHFAESM